jgi:hypothetical protein
MTIRDRRALQELVERAREQNPEVTQFIDRVIAYYDREVQEAEQRGAERALEQAKAAIQQLPLCWTPENPAYELIGRSETLGLVDELLTPSRASRATTGEENGKD